MTHSSDRPDDDPLYPADSVPHPAYKDLAPETPADEHSGNLQAVMDDLAADLAEAKSPQQMIEEAARDVSIAAEETAQTVRGAAEKGTQQATEAVADMQAKTAKAYDETANAAQAGLQDMAASFSDLNWKLMQFARVNMQNSVNFVQELAAARSLPDILRVQATYMQTQSRAFNDQMRELQTLTAGLTQSTAAPFKEQARNAGRLFTSC